MVGRGERRRQEGKETKDGKKKSEKYGQQQNKKETGRQ
jgi:hypothetical protein